MLSKSKVLSVNSMITFGKYKGKTIGEVLEADASYLIWATDNIDWFVLEDEILRQAEEYLYRDFEYDSIPYYEYYGDN